MIIKKRKNSTIYGGIRTHQQADEGLGASRNIG